MSTEMTADNSNGRWAERAASLYDERYARRYRDRDDELQAVQSNQALIDWLGSVCDRFDRPIDVLDLGCGTGRYFWGVRRAATLTGLDASAPMLEQARHPIHAERLAAVPITLIHGDVMRHTFPERSFDLVYSIGVLAEHVPLDRSVIERVHGWLRPGGRFAFTTVHPASPSVPRTVPRRLASAAVAVLPAIVTTALHQRLVGSGTYADERWITSVLGGKFIIESLERFSSDVHLHGRCVARTAS
jgi:ubiquinone/menaquinone biosynthesis C-methylase UbiE